MLQFAGVVLQRAGSTRHFFNIQTRPIIIVVVVVVSTTSFLVLSGICTLLHVIELHIIGIFVFILFGLWWRRYLLRSFVSLVPILTAFGAMILMVNLIGAFGSQFSYGFLFAQLGVRVCLS